MILSHIHFLILRFLATYYTLTCRQLQQLCEKPDTDSAGRSMRKHLTKLLHGGLINQCHGRVVFPDRNGAPAAVYFPSRQGCEVLAAEMKDERWLHACTLTPNWQNLYHWIEIARLRILFDRAVALQNDAQMTDWITEWTICNPQEKEPHKRYSLFTLLRDNPRLVFAPDASCVISYRGFRKGVYWEIDRVTSGINQISNSKTPGAARMAEDRAHVRHFPGVDAKTPFSVVHVSPSAGRRDLVAGAVSTKQSSHLWKFVAWEDLNPETALFEPILRDCDGKFLPLVRRVQGVSQ